MASARVIGVSVKPGGDGVDRDLVGRELARPSARQRRKRAFGASVVAHGRRAGHGERRSGIDDAPELALFHPRHDRLDRKECTLHVGVKQAIEERLVDLFDRRHHAGDAGVVDQNVDLAEFRFGCRDCALHLGDDAIVGLKAKRSDAVAF